MTVQETVEKAMSTILASDVEVVGAGRTDSGVHAKQMFAHFDLDEGLPENLKYRLNSFLPDDIAIHNILEVTPEAHARFDAVERSYEYLISPVKNVFSIDSAYNFYHKLGLDTMNQACQILFEYKDFQCFSKSRTDVKTYNCEIKSAEWKLEEDFIVFRISADRFLRNMVRAIAGTMIEIGTGKTSLKEFRAILESKNRSQAGYSVPAHGLYLTQITYPENLFVKI